MRPPTSAWGYRGWRGKMRVGNLEPEIPHAAAVARQIVETVQSVEMIDGEIGHRFRRREAHIHRDAAAAVLFQSQAAPAQHATASRAEADFERRIFLADACVNRRRSHD